MTYLLFWWINWKAYYKINNNCEPCKARNKNVEHKRSLIVNLAISSWLVILHHLCQISYVSCTIVLTIPSFNSRMQIDTAHPTKRTFWCLDCKTSDLIRTVLVISSFKRLAVIAGIFRYIASELETMQFLKFYLRLFIGEV